MTPDALRANIGSRMIYGLYETMINAKEGKKCLMVVTHKSQKSAIEEFLKDFQFRNNITVKLHKRRMRDD